MPTLFPGANTILGPTGSTVATGEWYSIPTQCDRLSFEAILQASSVGATAASTVIFQVSNSTLATSNGAMAGRTIALTCTTDLITGGGSLVSSMVSQWKFVRALVNSLTTSTAGSAGTPAVRAIVGVGSVK
jgi:hypothetical protein